MNTPYQLRGRVTENNNEVKVTSRNAPHWSSATYWDLQPCATVGKGWRSPASRLPLSVLLDFSAAAGVNDLFKECVRIRFRDRFLDGFRCTIHQILCFLQAQARDRTHY